MHFCMSWGRTLQKLDWESLRVFSAACRAGSFTRAARALGVEQSTVSRRIAALEIQLGHTLVERRARGIVVTPLGRQLDARVRAMHDAAARFGDDLGKTESTVEGEVRLALTESVAVHLLIPRILEQLFAKYPRITLRLSTSYRAAELGHDEAELALRFFEPKSRDLATEHVASLPLAWLGHRRYARVKAAEIPLVAVELAELEAYETSLLRRHAKRPIRLTCGSYVEQVEALRAGLGAGLVAERLLDLDASLVPLDLGLPKGPPLELWLVAPKSLRRVPRVDAVWRTLGRGLREVLG